MQSKHCSAIEKKKSIKTVNYQDCWTLVKPGWQTLLEAGAKSQNSHKEFNKTVILGKLFKMIVLQLLFFREKRYILPFTFLLAL